MIQMVKRAVAVLSVAYLQTTSNQGVYGFSDIQPIVGGIPSVPGAYPWMVDLAYIGSQNKFAHRCGGTVIATNAVLTAAHCVDSNVDVYIRAGGYNLDVDEANRKSYPVSKIVIHPEYDPISYANDIAIVISSVALGNQFTPVSLDLETASTYDPGTITRTIGWGATLNPAENDVILRQVDVPVISNEQCTDWYAVDNAAVLDVMICAGYEQGEQDSCSGDSGGPLLLVDSNGEVGKQIGIVSWGIGCAESKHPGVYTRVSRYGRFINQVLEMFPPTSGAQGTRECQCIGGDGVGDECGYWGHRVKTCFVKGGATCSSSIYSRTNQKFFVKECDLSVQVGFEFNSFALSLGATQGDLIRENLLEEQGRMRNGRNSFAILKLVSGIVVALGGSAMIVLKIRGLNQPQSEADVQVNDLFSEFRVGKKVNE